MEIEVLELMHMNDTWFFRLAIISLAFLIILVVAVGIAIWISMKRLNAQNNSLRDAVNDIQSAKESEKQTDAQPIVPVIGMNDKEIEALRIESLPEDEVESLPMPIIEKFAEGNFLLQIDKAIRGFFDTGVVTVNNMANIIGGGYSQATVYMDRLELAGIVGTKEYSQDRKLLLTRGEYEKVLRRKMLNYPNILEEMTVSNIIRQLSTDMYLLHTHCLDDVDQMDGTEFEYWCADLLRKLGYKNVEVTPASGDQGVDITATQGDFRYGFQCKRHTNDQGNTPIQEIFAGVRLYRLHAGVVITNQHFTAKAQELAAATCIVLWDRDWLKLTLRDLYGDTDSESNGESGAKQAKILTKPQ